MKKYYLTFLFCLLILASPKRIFAAGFTFTLDEQKFEVGQDEVNSWQGRTILSQTGILNPLPETVNNSLLKFVGQKTQTGGIKIYKYDLGSIYNYLDNLSEQINQQSVEPALTIEENKTTSFIPPQTGEEMDIYKSAFDALFLLQAGNEQSSLTVLKTEPKNNLAQTNNLGINELIASGISKFNGSPKNRRHNIAVGTEKFKGVIVPQGATFSFNENLGPVEAENGFLPELVIKRTGTVPELGGGLCQVSSTTFRAAMQAGLPIVERRNHAYAVQYYSPQGTDATIYPGVVDLKFINDTPGAILIWPYEKDSNTLVFDFYGTKDGRQVTLEKPITTDRKDDGSMKSSWTREVISANGQPRTDIFKSIYLSPALFHKEEQFVTATSTPNPAPQAPQTN